MLNMFDEKAKVARRVLLRGIPNGASAGWQIFCTLFDLKGSVKGCCLF